MASPSPVRRYLKDRRLLILISVLGSLAFFFGPIPTSAQGQTWLCEYSYYPCSGCNLNCCDPEIDPTCEVLAGYFYCRTGDDSGCYNQPGNWSYGWSCSECYCGCEGGDGSALCTVCASPTPTPTPTPTPGPACGDGTCDLDEDCASCEVDCGTCTECSSCDPWVDDACGNGGCLSSQMRQTRTCTGLCTDLEQCDERTLSVANFAVTPAIGDAAQTFTFSWDPVASSLCPVSPLTYALAVDDVGSFTNEVVDDTTFIDGPYAEGAHTVWIRVQDSLGRVSQSPYPSVTLDVDATGPEAPAPWIQSPGDCVISPGQNVNFSWDVPVDPGAGAVQDYRWTIDDADFSEWTGTWQIETEANWTATSGSHVFYVQARDTLLNLGEIGSIAVGAACVEGPDITLLSVDSCVERANPAQPTWTWTAQPRCAPELAPSNTYYYWLDINNDGIVDAGEDGYTTEASFTAGVDLDEGNTPFQVQATDSCGNTGPFDSLDGFVDTIGPTVTLSCSRGPDQLTLQDCSVLGEQCSQDNYFNWTWSATDPGGDPQNRLRSVALDGLEPYYVDATFLSPYYTSDESWEGVVPDSDELTTPYQWLDVTAYDACNNPGTSGGSSDQYRIDTAPPVVTIDVPF